MEQKTEKNNAYEEWEVMSFFYGLTIAYHLEQLTPEEFVEALKSLIFLDLHGTVWTIGSVSGEWYFRDEDDWIMGEPNTILHQIEKDEENVTKNTNERFEVDLKNPIIKELLKKM